MKLRDFIFRDLEFFIDNFVEEENKVSLQQLMPTVDVYKWGIAEPGRRGKIVICADRSGDVARTMHINSNPESWTVFFAFTPTDKINVSVLKTYDFISEAWEEGTTILRCCGFELDMKKDKSLLNLIRHP